MSYRILLGDVLERLRELPDESVQCVVTSPPYWGLRDYGTGTWLGGDSSCKHIKGEMRRGVNLSASVANTRGGAKKIAEVEDIPYGNICGRCGALRIDQQIGLEDTPEEYIAKMVKVFREVRRVLRSDGTCWVNMGDSYANDGKWGGSTGGKHVSANGTEAKRPLRHAVDAGVRVACGWLVAAPGHHLGQAEPDARERDRPLHQGA